MKRDIIEYTAPKADIVEVMVECGFDNSFSVGEWGDGGTEDGEAEQRDDETALSRLPYYSFSLLATTLYIENQTIIK